MVRIAKKEESINGIPLHDLFYFKPVRCILEKCKRNVISGRRLVDAMWNYPGNQFGHWLTPETYVADMKEWLIETRNLNKPIVFDLPSWPPQQIQQ